MAHPSVPHLHGEPPPDDGIPPVELYKNAVEEYRFQVQFNWSRTQYLLAFNAAILAAAVALSAREDRGASLVFALGVVASLLSAVAQRTQHRYYRAARDRLRRVETMFDIPEEARVDTTSKLGGRRQSVKVQHVVYLLFAAMAVAQFIGFLIVLIRA